MAQSKHTPGLLWRVVEDDATGMPRNNVPRDVPLIVSWKEPPYDHLHLHAQVATLSSFDGDWRSDATGEPIRIPTHWQPYMTLEDAIELGKTDNEANWDSPVRLEAHRIRSEAPVTADRA